MTGRDRRPLPRWGAPGSHRRWVPLVVAFLAFSGAARAAVDGGPHDVIAQGYDTARAAASRERCNRCHVATRDPAGLVPPVPAVLAGRWDAASLTCFSCHDGTTIVSAEVDASLTAFHPASHGSRPEGYEDLLRGDFGLPVGSGGRISCVTCHDPHDNGRRPMLRVELGDLCVACHAPLAGSGSGAENRTGNHPIGSVREAAQRPGAPLDIDGAFRVPYPEPYPPRGGSRAAGVHWDLGGHLGEGAEGDLACFTCHAVHGDEREPPRPGLLALDPVRDTADLFCEGCHAGARGDGLASPPRPNPGGTVAGRTYHPCDDDLANGPGRLAETAVPPAWPAGGGEPPRLVCTTCHAAHRGTPGEWLTRPPVSAETFCEECHGTLALDYHHPLEGDGPCGRILAPGAVSSGRLSCGGCHRAHNAGLGSPNEALFVPLLREAGGTAGCFVCHPEDNPTCNDRPDYRASHFLGDPAEIYDDTEPPLLRDPWPESKLASRYGAPGETVVTCLSCHAFAAGAIVSGDDGQTRGLLARSGNPVEWAEGGELNYLCTGCHTASPGTASVKGHSHPMMLADGAALGRPAEAPVTMTPSLHVNCDSCHRPHEAPTAGGYYILEEVRSDNVDPAAVHPRIDSSGVCRRCHDASKY